jgi:hypothetical protein
MFETTAREPERFAAWDGLVGASGQGVVIRAARAGDLVDHPEVRQVA